MQLPDFLQFKPFNELRELMRATKLGHFEFFDPVKHLTVQEREELVEGVIVSSDQIHILADQTLAFKNSRIVVSLPQPQRESDWLYHLCNCELMQTLQAQITQSASTSALRISTAKPSVAMGSFKVCGECLQTLRYQGFDGVRHRHREYSHRVQSEFNLDGFFKKFPLYPVVEEAQDLMF